MKNAVRSLAFAATAALVIAGCAPAATPTGSATLTSAVPSIASPSATQAESGPLQRTVVLDGVERFYTLFVPRALDRSKPAPLVVFLHGSGITANVTERDAGLDAQADRQGLLVAYPQATPGGWNHGCCNDAFAKKVDDVGFVRRIITDTSAEAKVDPDRIYVGGFSAGASMAYRLVCDIPELLAAVGAISGALVTEGCSPRADLSILEIHGTKDELVLYAGCSPTTKSCGNRAMTAAPAEQMVAGFRTLFGCPAPVVRHDGARTTTAASPCRGGTEISLLTVEGGVHQYPVASVTGGTLATADANEVLAFLLAHRRAPKR